MTDINTDAITSLVAVAPTDLPAAQASLTGFLTEKLASIDTECRELEENIAQGKRMLWRTKPMENALARAKKRAVFYEKIKQAISAGFLIIPSFPIQAFAVRVTGREPRVKQRGRWRGEVNTAPVQMLPAGEGRYVDDTTFTRSRTVDEPQDDGSTYPVTKYSTAEFDDEVEFPVSVVKPRILTRVEEAMALKVFDQIGLVGPHVDRDPIVVGQIKDPRGPAYAPRFVTFFIAWWLDPRTL